MPDYSKLNDYTLVETTHFGTLNESQGCRIRHFNFAARQVETFVREVLNEKHTVGYDKAVAASGSVAVGHSIQNFGDIEGQAEIEMMREILVNELKGKIPDSRTMRLP